MKSIHIALPLGLSMFLFLTGCGTSSGGGSSASIPQSTVTNGSASAGAVTTAGTVAPVDSTTPGSVTTFDSSRAFGLLQAQCNFGPRPMSSAAHQQTLQWLVTQLTPLMDAAPIQQAFPYTSPSSGQKFTVTNVIGRINPNATTQILLAAHWDTRSFADQDTTPANRLKPILGADDGASETSVLLELARVFHSNRPTVGVEFAFFDGEDYAPAPGNYNEMYLGAKYFATHLKDPTTGASLKPTFGVLLDMIGDKNLDIYEEQTSLAKAPAIVQKVWGAAASLGYGSSFIAQPKYTVEDDHLPLLQQGIPVIDCIDFDYESFDDTTRQYWHTLMDTPDHCSAQSLQIVGNVMSKVVFDER